LRPAGRATPRYPSRGDPYWGHPGGNGNDQRRGSRRSDRVPHHMQLACPLGGLQCSVARAGPQWVPIHSGECDQAGSDITQIRGAGDPGGPDPRPGHRALFYSDRLHRLGQGTVQGPGRWTGITGANGVPPG
jgi:hypothetical protein